MADKDNDQPSLAEEIEANRAIEQGLDVGARELAAQREPGGVVTPAAEDLERKDDPSTPTDQAAA